MLENSMEDRKMMAEIRQNNLDIRLGEVASSIKSTLQAETDSKIKEAVEALTRDVIKPLEKRITQHQTTTQIDINDAVEVAMTKVKKDLADDYHQCLTMNKEAKQSNKAAAEATKAAKAAESKLASATSALEKVTKTTTESIQGKITAIESAVI